MKEIIAIIFTTIFLSFSSHAGGGVGGSSGGGGSNPTQPFLTIQNQVIEDQEISLDSIDNIEIDFKIEYPKSKEEALILLRNKKIQSIQLIDGQIISY